jgi:hypothetical protein
MSLRGVGGVYREAVIQNSPGLQPWVSYAKRCALKVAPEEGEFGEVPY